MFTFALSFHCGSGGGVGTAHLLESAPADTTGMLGWHLYKRLQGATSWTSVATVLGTGDLDYTYTGLTSGTWEFLASPYSSSGDAPAGYVSSKVIP